MNLEFHPAVQRDVNEITAYYEREASAELADRFFNAVLAQLALAQVSQISAKFDYFCPLTALEPLILLGGACSAPLCADLGC
jgi:hypothetical protein